MVSSEDEKEFNQNDPSKAHIESYSQNENTTARWSTRQIIATVSLSILWVGSQVPLYFTGGMLSYMAADLGGVALTSSSWIPVCNTLAVASVAPFSGYLTDIFGRRNITLIGSILIMVGIVVVGTAHHFGQAVAGMSIAGAGAGIGELTALGGVAELVPVKHRGLYLGGIVSFLIPFTPYVLYSQLLSTRTAQGWRWCYWISLIYNFVAFVGMVFTYFPERHIVIEKESKMETLKKIDWLGAVLSITGIALFLVALQAGGYTHPWKSAYVLAQLIIGILLIIAFIIWEWKGAKVPMVPRELFQGQQTIGVTFLLLFVAGMNFYSLINFFPLTFSAVYAPDPVQVGLKGLGYGISVTAGAAIINWALSIFKNHNRELMIACCIVMTAFGGALAVVNPTNPKTAVALGTIAGFGVGGVLVPPSTIAITVCSDRLIATTVALSLSIRVIGGSIGYTIYFNIFGEKLKKVLPTYVAGAVVKAGLPESDVMGFVGTFLTDPMSIMSAPGATPAIIAAATRGSQDAYSYALKYVWYTSVAFGVVAIVAACFLGNNRKYLTDRVAAKIRN
ncbi:putative major facilitator superfamily transporter [Leptodontidium sp. MPI-SDFR-AT-0119]|nr:putative major facilitator superfamily transporter [Leptodontidium sp. MPI-SDFR-AT-0119]